MQNKSTVIIAYQECRLLPFWPQKHLLLRNHCLRMIPIGPALVLGSGAATEESLLSPVCSVFLIFNVKISSLWFDSTLLFERTSGPRPNAVCATIRTGRIINKWRTFRPGSRTTTCELLIAASHQPLACRIWVTRLEKVATFLLYRKITAINDVFLA